MSERLAREARIVRIADLLLEMEARMSQPAYLTDDGARATLPDLLRRLEAVSVDLHRAAEAQLTSDPGALEALARIIEHHARRLAADVDAIEHAGPGA